MEPAEIYAEFKKHGGIADLSSRAKFRLTGADRVRFLNGQVSNDVRKLKTGEAMHACVLTAKGKMCGDVFISADEDFLRIDADPSLRESLTARLERYIIADDVALEDATERESLLHVFNEMPVRSREVIMLARPAIHNSRRLGMNGRDIFIDGKAASNLARQLMEDFVFVDDTMLETLRVEAGVPRWGFELNEEIIPQEALLERDVIDFHKGCYVGQEVVSRIKSVGHVNKQLRGFVQSGDGAPLRRGMKVFAPENPEKEAGWITSAAYSFGLARPAALGYLKRGVAATVLDARDESSSCRVEVKDLPLIP